MTLPTPIKRTVLACTVCMAVSQTAAAVTEEEFQALQEQLNLLADQVEQNSTGSNDATTIGGYGELHYNNWSDDQGNTFKELDFHRFVLMINHEFNDDIRFFSEFEIEHAYIEDTDDGSSTGYVAVEQAYVQFDLSEHTKANAGIFLVPVGILNETHEPATFYGVERNPVERNIIPTTWSEAGAFLSGYYGSGFSYDLALSSGLDGGTMFYSLIVALTFMVGLVSAQQNGFYDFKVKTLEGNEFDFSGLKGKKVMVVNTASKCGLTPQYEDLQELYEKYGGDDFIIVGFPANNFMKQEPGTDSEIRTFCTENYGVTFPMMAKISVKGDDIHPLYKWLTTKDLNGVEDSQVSWNFQKYLIDENGNLVKHLKPTKKPLSKEILDWLDS